jgi:hypothetical protein
MKSRSARNERRSVAMGGRARRLMACVVLVVVAVAVAQIDTTVGNAATRQAVVPVPGFYQRDTDATFNLMFVAFKANKPQLDYVLIACGTATFSSLTSSKVNKPGDLNKAADETNLDYGFPVTIGTNVKVSNGRFALATKHVAIKGRFDTPTSAQGSIRALPALKRASECGIPKQGTWTAACSLGVEKKNDGISTVDPTGACAEQAAASEEGGGASE